MNSPLDAQQANTAAPAESEAIKRHTAQKALFSSLGEAMAGRERTLSLARLLLFLGGAVTLFAGVYDGIATWAALGGLALLGFVGAIVMHLRVLKQLEAANIRRDIHGRHLARLGRAWREFPGHGPEHILTGHAYGYDIDLTGPGSLLQRIDVAHTRKGKQTLVEFLSAAAPMEEALERQIAVRELACMHGFRQELEATALCASEGGKPASNAALDGSGFSAFAKMPVLFAGKPWLAPLCFLLPPITISLLIGEQLGLVPPIAWVGTLTLQGVVMLSFQSAVSRAFNLATARQGTVEAFENMLRLVEHTDFQAPHLQNMKARLMVDAQPPSAKLAELRRWVSFGELRQQFLLWAVLNPLLLWDLHILRGMERWNRGAGRKTADWFVVLGEFEALAALATLHALEPDTVFPTLLPSSEALSFTELAHPLLPQDARVRNSVALQGPGSALIVTGSNMAGKSTLLRAVGLNIALALAGGPVCAQAARVPYRRLRASMRAQDNLQEGASYFHAELSKLRSVVEDANGDPPLLFLLDELLRGTNEQARHLGAKAVLMHLLGRNGSGLVATHDIALAAHAPDDGQQLENVHFTDVMEAGEMRFDYRLRPGIVKSSNALQLLAMAGIDVPAGAANSDQELGAHHSQVEGLASPAVKQRGASKAPS